VPQGRVSRHASVGRACLPPLVLGQGDQLPDRLNGEFGRHPVGWPWSEARGRDRQPQQHVVLIGNEDVAAAARPAHRYQREPPTEKRVPGIGDLNLDYIPAGRVVEGGIN
jgi:hypothetical protein